MLGQDPLGVRDWRSQDCTESHVHLSVKILAHLIVDIPVHCPDGEHKLGECETGAEEDKLNVRIV